MRNKMAVMMKAAVLTGPNEITVKTVPVPEMKAGDIKIKVSACGVCGSDIHMWKTGKGWNPNHKGDFWMGHEFCGVVTDAGTSGFKPGERVVFWANLYCGQCDMCRSGQEHLCLDVNGTNYIGFVCNGAYAEQFVGKAFNAYRLPDSVSDVDAALIDPLMVTYHAVLRSGLKLHDKVLVVGDGNDPERAQMMQKASGGGFDIAFEVVGASSALSTCIDGVKAGGKVVMIGNSIKPTVAFELNRAVLHEITLIGSVSCTEKEFRETIDLIAKKTIKPERYVTDIVGLDDLQKSFERLVSPTDPALKIVVKP